MNSLSSQPWVWSSSASVHKRSVYYRALTELQKPSSDAVLGGVFLNLFLFIHFIENVCSRHVCYTCGCYRWRQTEIQQPWCKIEKVFRYLSSYDSLLNIHYIYTDRPVNSVHVVSLRSDPVSPSELPYFSQWQMFPRDFSPNVLMPWLHIVMG